MKWETSRLLLECKHPLFLSGWLAFWECRLLGTVTLWLEQRAQSPPG